jgi:O-antigen/teichoic acid export membrane protein
MTLDQFSETAAAATGQPLAAATDDGRLARQTLIYGLAGVAPQALGVLTVPVFARVFTEAEFGLFEVALVALTVATTAAESGISSAAHRSFFDYTDQEEGKRRAVLTTALALAASFSSAVAIVAVLAREPLSRLLFGTPDQTELVVLIALTVPALLLATFVRELMRLRFQANHFLVSSLIVAVLGAAASVIALLVFDAGVDGVLAAMLLANAAALLYGLVTVRGGLGRTFSGAEARTMLAFGLPLIPAALALWALALIDRLMLRALDDLDAVGQYAVANRVAMVIQLGLTGFLLALGPFLLNIFSTDREAEKIVRGRTLTYLAFMLALAGLAVTLFAREVTAILAPGYGDAYRAVGPVAFGWVAFGIASLAMAGITLARRTAYFAVLAGAAAVFNVALNFAFIPLWGMIGAALATAAAYGALAVMYYLVAQRLYPTPYEPMKVVAIVALAVVWSFPGYLAIEPLALALVVKLAALGGFLASLAVSRTMGPPEFRELGRFGRGMLSFSRP